MRLATTLLLLTLSACQPASEAMRVEFPNGKLRFEASVVDGRYDGTYRRYYLNGRRAFEGKYESGLLQGEWVEWHDNGIIARRANSVDGHLHGRVTIFDTEGEVTEEQQYVAGWQDGRSVRWNTNGWQRTVMWSKGRKHGVERVTRDDGSVAEDMRFHNGIALDRTMFHPGGTKESFVELKNGLEAGMKVTWYDSGQIRERSFYAHGIRHGRLVRWHGDGKKAQQGEYYADKKQGLWVEWFLTGETESAGWEKGEMQGERILLKPNGWRERSIYHKDQKHGPITTFRPAGGKETQGRYKWDLRDDEWRYWHPNGTLGKRIHYLDNKLHGLSEKWTPAGELVETGAYEHDQRTGRWFSVRKNGMAVTDHWENGQRHGDSMRMSTDEVILEEGKYREGERVGLWVARHKGGGESSRGLYKNGKRAGNWLFWGGRGAPDEKLSGFYEDGERSGPKRL